MRLGKVLADYRYANRIGVRALATEIGISSATLSRIENDNKMDGDVLVRIMAWLFADGDKRKVKDKP
jgi:transcriptional regulator with XRE-family HTH domain